jgi:flagellar basal body rod protein FlgC
MVAAAFGLATATAAASGVFGDAVYIPVVSDALAKADLVALPKYEPQRKKSVVVEEAKIDLPPRETVAEPLGKGLVVQKLTDLRKDPAYRALSPAQKVARLKLEFADMLAAGKVTNADLKAARQQWHQERKARDQAQFRQDSPVLKQRAAELRKQRNEREPKALSPEQKAKVRDAFAQLSPEQQSELRDLRQRRREANPADRRAINAEIRAFWQKTGGKPAPQDTDLVANDAQP